MELPLAPGDYQHSQPQLGRLTTWHFASQVVKVSWHVSASLREKIITN